MSTFLVECDPATWQLTALPTRRSKSRKAICEHVFAATLDGHRAGVEQIGVAQFPVDLERTLVVRQ